MDSRQGLILRPFWQQRTRIKHDLGGIKFDSSRDGWWCWGIGAAMADSPERHMRTKWPVPRLHILTLEHAFDFPDDVG